MTAIVWNLHSHALGKSHGWWGSAIHPAHLDPEHEGKFIKGTEWHVTVSNCPFLAMAVERLELEVGYAEASSVCGPHEFETPHP